MNEPTPAKPIVVFIDDDDGPMVYYEEALNDAGFRVERIRDLKQALDYVANTSDKPSAWLVDVMMPVKDQDLVVDGENVARLTNLGLAAGLLLYRKIKSRFASQPVILLTSIATPALLNSIEANLAEGDTCEAKIAVLPSQLAELVEERIRHVTP
jgi:CheY-like chemotaxis protein